MIAYILPLIPRFAHAQQGSIPTDAPGSFVESGGDTLPSIDFGTGSNGGSTPVMPTANPDPIPGGNISVPPSAGGGTTDGSNGGSSVGGNSPGTGGYNPEHSYFNGGELNYVDIHYGNPTRDAGYDIYPGGPYCSDFTLYPVVYRCPPQYEFQEDLDLCLRRVQRKPIEKCDSGLQESVNGAKRCVATHYEVPEYKCPEDFTAFGKVCKKIELTGQRLLCPIGYDIDGTACSQEVSTPFIEQCPTRMHLVDGMCYGFRYSPSSIKCRDGYELNSEGRCVKPTIQAGNFQCEDNFHNAGKKCVRFNDYPVLKKCPEGFQITGKTCQKVVAVQTFKICNRGVMDEAQEACFIDEYTDKKCSGKDCGETIYEQPVDVCPPSFTLEGERCVSRLSRPMESYCTDDNDALEGDTCRAIETGDKRLVCPEDFQAVEGVCKMFEMYTPLVSCPDLSGQSPPWNARGGFHSDYAFRDDSIDCELLESSEPDKICPIGFQSRGNSCVKTRHELGDLICPIGYKRDSILGKCMRHIEQSPEPICPIFMELKDSICMREIDTSQHMFCPDGYDFDGKLCHLELETSKVPACGSGDFYDRKLEKCFLCGEEEEIIEEQLLDLDVEEAVPIVPSTPVVMRPALKGFEMTLDPLFKKTSSYF